ncbi:MAG: PAS domain-containing protein [Caldilineaceae bacterium]|nr:PAS domain-containing protein [Caldilineaceae bacterium]
MTNQAMVNPISPAMLKTLHHLQWVASLSTILLGFLFVEQAALFAWAAAPIPLPLMMKTNTALAFILCGLALGLTQLPSVPGHRYWAKVAAVLVLVLSGVTLAQYLLGWDSGINTLFAGAHASAPTSFLANGMAFNTALCFLLVSCALLVLDAEFAWGRPTEWLTLVAGFITLMTLVGYIYEVDELVGFFDFTGMAFSVVIAFGVLCWGILMARPQQGMMALFWSNGPQGMMARRMAFGGTLSLLLLSCLTEWGERAGLYSRDLESALLLSSGIAVFSLLVYQSMRAVAHLEQQRQLGLAELQSQYLLLQGIVNSTHDGIYMRDLQGRYLLVNETAATFAGMKPAEMLRRTYDEIFPAATAAAIAAEDAALLINGEVQVQEMEAELNGQFVSLHSVKTPYRDAAGNMLGVLNVVRDITERKQAEAHLQAAQQKQAELLALLEALLDNAPIGFAFLDHSLRFVRVNPQLARLTRLSMASHLGESLATVLPPLAPMIGPTIEQVFATGQGVYNQPLSGTNPTQPDEVWHVLASWYPVTIDATGVQFVGAAVIDVTELRHAEAELRRLNDTLGQRVAERTAELERSNRDLDEFAYVASHDLKAPLRAIVNLANWITEDAAAVLPAPSREHLTKLRGRAQRMERLLDDLLAYSRVGRHDGATEMVDVAALLQDMFDLLAPPPGFKLTLLGPMPTLRTARTPLELVFRNLLGNAIKHHHQPEQGEVQIRAEEAATHFLFHVRDNGPGIDPQFHTRIFGIFQTLQPRDQSEGSGMGLALIKKAVEYRGGTVSVHSAIGQGATFSFTWPKQKIAAP